MTKTFDDIIEKIRQVEFVETFDMVIAIARGGIIPAALVAQRLGIDLQLLKIRLKDENQKPMWEKPHLMEAINFDIKGKRILLVDDRIKTGTTITFAKGLLRDAALIKTLAVNGNADYSLYNEACFPFPWTS
ncbi:MAG: phosphoribosyltransferase [Bacteroidales bacterium]|jgi:xanthine phosphoribosyltransferase|nr:phosphoribosyltransferase [Bacteroidales bacterium]